MTTKPLRELLLEEIAHRISIHPTQLQTEVVLGEVKRRAGGRVSDQALLTLWFDMFRTGLIAPGYDLANPALPFCHLTEHGRRALAQASRDPSNPDGYLRALEVIGPLQDVVKSYIEEALQTYISGCFKAAAVMVGCASEALLMEIRNAIVARLGVLSRTPPPALTDWRAKTVLDAVNAELSRHTRLMDAKLREPFQQYWTAFLQQIRAGRNEAGHPSSIAPITPESVHASLLIFPELHKLSHQLLPWVAASMP